MTKVLIIDDEELIRDRMQKLLELDDYETLSAGDGPTGLELLEKEKPDIALVDIRLPGMDGIEVLKRIKDSTGDTAVIIITGHGELKSAIEAMKTGAFGYVQKPIVYDELEIEIRRAIEKQELHRKLAENLCTLERAHDELEQRVKDRTAELSLSNEELKLQSEIASNMSEGVYLISVRDCKIIYTNPRFEEMFGYGPGEMIGQDASIVNAPSDMAPQETVEHTLGILKQTGTWRGEIRNIKKDGTFFWSIASASIYEHHGHGEIIVSVHTDITERKQAEEERRKLETQLQQSQKMEAIGTLAGGISHDFNNMLGIIIGNTELAMMEIPESNQAYDNLLEIRRTSLQAADMVKQILAFSRRSDAEFAPLEIGPIIKESLKMLRFSIPKTIEIMHNGSGKTDPIRGNPTQINQILLNLCTNAAHAMREKGGRLEIGVNNTMLDEDAATQSPDLACGKYVKLTVSDTGKGMDPHVSARIFEPYFTTKGVGEGTGMGLSVVHGIVKNHQGAITVHSEPEKGTTFDVFFPSIEGRVEPERMTTHTFPRGDERILLIDDEPAMAKTVQSMLERLGYEISVRTSSIEALEAFKARPDKYDLVITDQTMPHLTGQVLAREMMEIRPDIPVILCTGYSDLIDEDMAMEMGIAAFVKKPMMIGEIAKTIRTVVDSALPE